MSSGRPRGAGIAGVPGGGGGPDYRSAASASRGLGPVLSWQRAVREAPPSWRAWQTHPTKRSGKWANLRTSSEKGRARPGSPAPTQGPFCDLGVWPGGGGGDEPRPWPPASLPTAAATRFSSLIPVPVGLLQALLASAFSDYAAPPRKGGSGSSAPPALPRDPTPGGRRSMRVVPGARD